MVELPAKQCPPLRTASGMPRPVAKASTAATSAGPAQRATAAGRVPANRATAGARAAS